MTRLPVPLASLDRRIPEAGRLRIGVRSGRAMKAIDTWRFTSHDRTALAQVAALYGGTVKPWSDPKAAPGQFELITTANEIRVVLPPEPLSGPVYELWSGGGCERRCDGIDCEVVQKGPDGMEPVTVPCLCSAKGALACRVTTRLSVMLADVRFVGVWRLDTKSENAAAELPGMVELIQSLGQGMTRGVLSIRSRRSVRGGETHQFKVPTLGLEQTVDQLASGSASLDSLPTGPALPAAQYPALGSADDEVVEGEIVEDGPVCTACGGSLAGCAAAKDPDGFHHTDVDECRAEVPA